MVEATFNMFDAAVILVIMLSTMLAFFRGFVREFLSLGAWVAAGIVTLYAYQAVAEKLMPHTSSDTVAFLLAGAGTYVTVLLGLSIFNSMVVRYVKSGDEVGMFDNFLGLLFGLLRGAFIVSLGYVVLSLVIDNENPPVWVEEAATRPIVQKGAIILANIAPEYLEEISSLSTDLQKEVESQAVDALADGKIELFEGQDSKLIIDNEKGYSDQERQLLEKLMQSR